MLFCKVKEVIKCFKQVSKKSRFVFQKHNARVLSEDFSKRAVSVDW